MPANLNLHTYRLFNGTLVSPIGFTNQVLPDCSSGYSVTQVLYNTVLNSIVYSLGANVVACLKVVNNCTSDYSIVEGNYYSIKTYLDDNCCPQYDACITFTTVVPSFDICIDGEFNYPLLADFTAYGGAVDTLVESDQDLNDILFSLIGYHVIVSECRICFPNNYGGVIVDIPVNVLVSPFTDIELNPLNTYEVQWSDIHGSSNGIPCATWISQTNTFDIGGALLAVSNVSPIQLCDFDLSSLALSSNYSGLLTATRTVEDCGGIYVDVVTFYITTDSNGLIKTINSNYCYVPKSTPTPTTINVNQISGTVHIDIANEYQYQGVGALIPIVTDECAELKLYNMSTNSLIGHVQGSTMASVDTWTDILGNITSHVGIGQLVASFDFDFIAYCESNSIFVDPLNKDINLKLVSYVGGTCPSVVAPTIIVQSFNADNFTQLVFDCADYDIALTVTENNFDDAFFNGQPTTSYIIAQVAGDGCDDRINRDLLPTTTMVGTKIYDWDVSSINGLATDIGTLGAFLNVSPLNINVCTRIAFDYSNNSVGEKSTLITLLIRNLVGCEQYAFFGNGNTTVSTNCGWSTGPESFIGGSACFSSAYNNLTNIDPFGAVFASKTDSRKNNVWVSGNIQNLFQLATNIVWEILVNGIPVITQIGGYTFLYYDNSFTATYGLIIGDQIEYRVTADVGLTTYSHSSVSCPALDAALVKTA